MNACFKCGAPATNEFCWNCMMGNEMKKSFSMVFGDKVIPNAHHAVMCVCGEVYPIEMPKCYKCGRKRPFEIKEEKQTFGFDEALRRLKAGKWVKRKHWGGYWFIPATVRLEVERDFMNKMIVASLKDDGGYVPAQPYMEDLLSEDWEEVE